MSATRLRLESKYLLSAQKYYRLRGSLAPHFQLDRHSRLSPGGRYCVRSLYYDSYDYQAYFEKVTGENQRLKLRLRAYGDAAGKTDFINVEMKRRQGAWIAKDVERVSHEACRSFLLGRSWPGKSSPLLQEFEFHIRRYNLLPKVLVEYRREAWYNRVKGAVRLSFDHGSRYVQTDTLFPDRLFFQTDLTGTIVFEIKSAIDDLDLISRLVRDFKGTSKNTHTEL